MGNARFIKKAMVSLKLLLNLNIPKNGKVKDQKTADLH